VTEHHGRVRVEDNQPNGARFIVELNPLQSADSQSPGYSEIVESNAQ
jgi:hypothetical protein